MPDELFSNSDLLNDDEFLSEIYGDDTEDEEDVMEESPSQTSPDNIPFYKKGFIPKDQNDLMFVDKVLKNPKSIYQYLQSNIYGHFEYIEKLSVFLWKASHNIRPGAILVCGETGTGKTEAIRIISRIYHNIVIANGAELTPEGYKGNSKLSYCLRGLDFSEGANMPICVIDEFDKLLDRCNGAWSDSGMLAELLKFLEGGKSDIGTSDKPLMVDTSETAFILLGSFSSISESKESKPIGFNRNISSKNKKKTLTESQIIELMPSELKGRIEEIIILDSFHTDDYFRILNSNEYSPLQKIERQLGITIELSNLQTTNFARRAYDSGVGVRFLNNEINCFINKHIFDDPDIKSLSWDRDPDEYLNFDTPNKGEAEL